MFVPGVSESVNQVKMKELRSNNCYEIKNDLHFFSFLRNASMVFKLYPFIKQRMHGEHGREREIEHSRYICDRNEIN